MTAVYEVDLGQLTSTVDSLAGAESRLSSLVDDLHARVDALHLTWTGLAADSHAGAHRAWESGFADMREALGVMRSAALSAHGHYSEAARLNTSLWSQLR